MVGGRTGEDEESDMVEGICMEGLSRPRESCSEFAFVSGQGECTISFPFQVFFLHLSPIVCLSSVKWLMHKVGTYW
jgi:hypothetical protein